MANEGLVKPDRAGCCAAKALTALKEAERCAIGTAIAAIKGAARFVELSDLQWQAIGYMLASGVDEGQLIAWADRRKRGPRKPSELEIRLRAAGADDEVVAAVLEQRRAKTRERQRAYQAARVLSGGATKQTQAAARMAEKRMARKMAAAAE